MLRTMCWTVLAGAVFVAGPTVRAGGQPTIPDKAADGTITLKKALLAAARKTYEDDLARLKNRVGSFSPDVLYRWSRRWLDAQRDLTQNKGQRAAAFQQHLDRMKELERMFKMLAQTGQGRAADASAAEYFRIQAELWKERARTAAPAPGRTFWIDPRTGNQYFVGEQQGAGAKR